MPRGMGDMINPDKQAALIIIDMQKAIDEPYWAEYGPRNNPEAEQKLSQLIIRWRETGRPVIFIRHDSTEIHSAFRPDKATHAFKDDLTPETGDKVVAKKVNSAFIGTDLEDYLRQKGITQLFFSGVKTNNSVEATVRMAANLGFDCFLLHDCCFTFGLKDFGGVIRSAQDVHHMSLANLHGEYCQIISSDDLRV